MKIKRERQGDRNREKQGWGRDENRQRYRIGEKKKKNTKEVKDVN